MGGGAQQRGFRLDGPRREQLTLQIVGVLDDPGRSLDGAQLDVAQAGGAGLAGELVGQVEVGGGEELRSGLDVGVAVLTLAQITLDDRAERRIVEDAALESVEERCEAEMPTATTTPPGLATLTASEKAVARSSRSAKW